MGRIRDLDESRHGHGAALALRALGVLVLVLSLVMPWGPTARADPFAGLEDLGDVGFRPFADGAWRDQPGTGRGR